MRYVLTCCLLFVFASATASIPEVDSLNNLAYSLRKKNPRQSLAAGRLSLARSHAMDYQAGISAAYLHLGNAYRYLNLPDSAIYWLEAGIDYDLSNQIEGIDDKYNSLGLTYKNQNNKEQALKAFAEAESIRKQRNDWLGVAKLYNNIGNTYKRAELYELAFSYYARSILLKDSLEYKKGIATTRINMGNVLAMQGQHKKALEYQLANIIYFREQTDTPYLALSLFNYANTALDSVQQYEEVLIDTTIQGKQFRLLDEVFMVDTVALLSISPFIREGKMLYQNLGFTHYIGAIELQEGSIALRLGKYELALNLFQSAIEKLGVDAYDQRAHCLQNMGLVYFIQGNFRQALPYFQQAYDIANPKEYQHILKRLHTQFSVSYKALGQYELAFDHLKTYELLVLREKLRRTSRQIAEQEAKYQVALNQRQALEAQLDAEEQKTAKTRLGYILLATLVGFIGFAAFMMLRNKNIELSHEQENLRHAAEVDQLLGEQRNKMLEAEIQGQDRERTRIANELHGRVGMALAAAKMHVEALPEAQPTGKIVQILDAAMDDTRRISHNLASEVLNRNGLVVALEELAEMVTARGILEVDLRTIQFDQHLSKQQELHLYRIIEELLNNTLKHSGARRFEVQLVMEDKTLNLTAKDDGVGMDVEQVQRGLGLNNIDTRVKALGAEWDIYSHSDTGTMARIRLPLT